jgi:hypothetical protein
MFHNTKYDWDLIVTIQELIVRWSRDISFSFHWVEGHTDLIEQPLARNEILNIKADLHADVIRAQARGPIAARPNCAHWDIEEASLSIRGRKVTSDMKNQLTSQIHDDDLHTFRMTKETWYTHTFNSIDLHASALALRRLSKNRQMNTLTGTHGITIRLPTEETVHTAPIRTPKKIGDTS